MSSGWSFFKSGLSINAIPISRQISAAIFRIAIKSIPSLPYSLARVVLDQILQFQVAPSVARPRRLRKHLRSRPAFGPG
jgi:hypothetical protein